MSIATYEYREGEWLVSSDPDLLDFDVIHGYLAQSYWSEGISMEQVRRQTEHSTLAFGLYRLPTLAVGSAQEPGRIQQIGFARVLSDLARFGYLADVFIVREQQRRGLGQLMLRAILDHPELKDVRKWILATDDAHGVYEKLGFELLDNPEKYMVRRNKDRWL